MSVDAGGEVKRGKGVGRGMYRVPPKFPSAQLFWSPSLFAVGIRIYNAPNLRRDTPNFD